MEVKLNVQLLEHTPNPERLVATAAKLCYSKSEIKTLMSDLTLEKIESFVQKLESLGHESPFEHISFTFGIEGVSRALSHQHVRHRHQSISQQSQRYCSAEDFNYVIPPTIVSNPEALNEFIDCILYVNKKYKRLIELGIPAEDARYLLSNAAETKMVVTLNARSLFNYFAHRCCERAQWEIRVLARAMLKLVKMPAPNVFRHAGPNCLKGFCPEGRMSCGKVPTLDTLKKSYKQIGA